MNNIVPILLLPALFFLVGFQAPPAFQHGSPAGMSPRETITIAPGMIIVKIKPGNPFHIAAAALGIAAIDEVLHDLGAKDVEPFYASRNPAKRMSQAESAVARIVKVSYASGRDPRDAARELSLLDAVEYAEPSYIYPMNHSPNDPMASQQSVISLLKLTQAWDISTGDSTIIIGDVDSGCDWTHPDLRPNIYINRGEWGTSGELSNNGRDDDGNGKVDDWHGWDFVGNGSDTSPIPDNDPMDGVIGHGTMTAGCASAATNNGIGIASPGYRTKILPVKAASNSSGGISYGYQGIMYAADMGCRVINTSWGGIGSYSQAMQDVINYANAKGALVVASSGNNPYDNDYVPHYPSSLDHVLCVGSTETNGTASTWCTYGTSVHVYALGMRILTTAAGGNYSNPSAVQGTSFSSPYTAGVAALVFSMHPTWTPDQVAKQIRVTCDLYGTTPNAKRYGAVNAYRALSLNQTLSDIPGIRLYGFGAAVSGGGANFTQPGQTARVTMVLENVLAPTSDNAVGTVELESSSLSCPQPSIPIGKLHTFEQKTVTFDVVLSQTPTVSEGNLPIRLKITDGSYVDYVMGRMSIYLAEGWHMSANFGAPSITSIDALDQNVVWAVAHVASPLSDYCLKTVNGGLNWSSATPSNYFGGVGLYCVTGVSGNVALAGSGPTNGAAEIWRTANGGLTWNKTSVSTITGFVDAIQMFDANNGIFIGDPLNGKWGLGQTTDGGVSWSPIASPLSAPTGEAGWNNSCDFIGDVGWFGTNNYKIYKTTDRGQSWTSFRLPEQNVTGISFRDEMIGAARFSTVSSQGRNALAVTSDGGTTWKTITSTSVVDGTSVRMERGGTRLWVVTPTVAMVSTDLGATWTPNPGPSGGYGTVACSDAYVGGGYTDVYTGSSIICKLRAPTLRSSASNHPQPGDLFLAQNYPHPAAGGSPTEIRFAVPRAGRVRLTIYDQLGRELLTVFDAVIAPGAHAVSLSTGRLPAGTYHYVLRTGRESVARSMVVLR